MAAPQSTNQPFHFSDYQYKNEAPDVRPIIDKHKCHKRKDDDEKKILKPGSVPPKTVAGKNKAYVYRHHQRNLWNEKKIKNIPNGQ